MTVAAGTLVRIESPITWQLAPDAVLVNNGLIDFGTQATLVEAPGSPITGTGTETAQWAPAAPLVDAEPGGLGLRLNTAYGDGGLVVERGHVPRTVANGTLSIARWFMVTTPQPTTAVLDGTLRYDLSELNGIVADDLALFTASSADGPWTPVISNSNAAMQEVSGTAAAPLIFLTAFDFDAAMHHAPGATHQWQCWPTVVAEELWLRTPPDEALRTLTLSDAVGRTWPLSARTEAQSVVRIELPPLASGLYHLRINDGAVTFKLVKP